jgi:hypothetical protein
MVTWAARDARRKPGLNNTVLQELSDCYIEVILLLFSTCWIYFADNYFISRNQRLVPSSTPVNPGHLQPPKPRDE